MTTTYKSECVQYVGQPEQGGKKAIINKYAPEITNKTPNPFIITINSRFETTDPNLPYLGAIVYSILLQYDNANNFRYILAYYINKDESIAKVENSTIMPKGISVASSAGNRINEITINRNDVFTSEQYTPGDKYILNLEFCDDGAQATLERPLPSGNFSGSLNIIGSIGAEQNNVVNNLICTDCSCLIATNCKTVNVPLVYMLGQVTVDFSDVGDVIFTICDKYQYYECKKIACDENKCSVEYIDRKDLKQTKFRQCCPFIVSVLKGQGETAKEKSDYLWERNKTEIGISQPDFYENIILYAMSKYILSRILYGKFNINYLLGKYNDRFLRDLGESRFCAAVKIFIDCESAIYGYNKYFLENCKQ